MLRRLALGVLLSALVCPCALTAQPWITRQQDALWVGATIDKPVTPKLALWFDGSWRRMELGSEPQQLLLRPGL